MPTLTSTRLNYYSLSQKYFEEFCQMDMDPKVMRYYRSRAHGTKEDALKTFNRYIEYMKEYPDLGGFMVFEKITREFVGLVVIIHLELNPHNHGYEIGYRLAKHKWNRGYATEMARAMLNYGFGSLGLSEIFETTNPENIASEKVLLKCGFHKVGTSAHYGGSHLFKIMNQN